MLYRILRDLGSLDATRRKAAIRMARGLPWEDLEQFLTFFDKGQADSRRGAWTILLILLVVGAGVVSLFSGELVRRNLIVPVGVAAGAIPLLYLFNYVSSRKRAESGLRTILDEVDDAAFVPVGLGILSEKHADALSFRPDLLRAIARLMPEVSIEQCREWTPEERYCLIHGLNTVLPAGAGGRDALSHSNGDYALVILKVLQRIGDGREAEVVRLVSTIDPITERHQKVREAAVKCLRSIDKRLHGEAGEPAHPPAPAAAPPKKVSHLTETDISYLLKRRTAPPV